MTLGWPTKGPAVQPSEWPVHPSFLLRVSHPTHHPLSPWPLLVHPLLVLGERDPDRHSAERLAPSQVPPLRSLESNEGAEERGVLAQGLKPTLPWESATPAAASSHSQRLLGFSHPARPLKRVPSGVSGSAPGLADCLAVEQPWGSPRPLRRSVAVRTQ